MLLSACLLLLLMPVESNSHSHFHAFSSCSYSLLRPTLQYIYYVLLHALPPLLRQICFVETMGRLGHACFRKPPSRIHAEKASIPVKCPAAFFLALLRARTSSSFIIQWKIGGGVGFDELQCYKELHVCQVSASDTSWSTRLPFSSGPWDMRIVWKVCLRKQDSSCSLA